MARAPWAGIERLGYMNKAAIIARVAARMDLDMFTAEGMVDAVLEAIVEGLAKEEDVRIAVIGSFRTKRRAARRGRKLQLSFEY